jgi:DNA-binding response OmpR family regulator
VPHEVLLKIAWGEGYQLGDVGVLWRTIDRIRRKLSKVLPDTDFIHVDRRVGYKFAPNQNKPDGKAV